MKKTLTSLAALAGFVFLTTPALAHTGLHSTGFAAGISHPLGGLDHLLVMAGTGIWAARLGGRDLWLVPLAFVGAMIMGAAVALIGFPLPYVELGIAGSVIVIGLLAGLGARLPGAAALVAALAVFHGHAHGTELPKMASAWSYGAGFVLSTGLLHAIGIGLGLAAYLFRPVLRSAGAETAAPSLVCQTGRPFMADIVDV